MDKKRIEENRKKFNIDDSFVFDYVKELDLWIIGGYGIIDIFNFEGYLPEEIRDENTIKFYNATEEDLPAGENAFLPYLTECDASEGISFVKKFKYPLIYEYGDISDVDIFLIKCTNNGISYFACEYPCVLQAFLLAVNEGCPSDVKSVFKLDNSYLFDHIDWLDWWLISNKNFPSVECWPSNTKWASTTDMTEYAEKLFPHTSEDGEIRELKSFCWFEIPFWNGELEVWKELIFAIKCADNTMYYASDNPHALRAALHNLNDSVMQNNEWRKNHPNEATPKKISTKKNGNTTINYFFNNVGHDVVVGDKHIDNQVNGVGIGSVGININKQNQ